MLVKVLVLNPISHGTEDFCDIRLVDDSLGGLPLLRNVSCSQLHEYLDGADSVETNFELSGNNLVMVNDQPYFPNRKPVEKSLVDFDPNNIFGKSLDDWYFEAGCAYKRYTRSSSDSANFEEIISLDDFKAALEGMYVEVANSGDEDDLHSLLNDWVYNGVLRGGFYAL